jgi:integrase
LAKIRKRTWKSGGAIKSAWIADYFDQAGKRCQKTFKQKKEADAWLVQARHQLQFGTHVPDSASISVAKAAAIWLERGELEGLENSTMEEYRTLVRLHIEPAIGSLKLSRLSTPAIEAYRDSLLRKCSRPRSRKVLTALKGILAEAQRRGLIAHNPAAPVRVSVNRREITKLASGHGIPSKEEIRDIVEHATGRMRPLLVTAIFTGMRASEVRGLTWDNVDFERRVIHVRQRADRWGTIGAPKSAAGRREIPMSPMVVNVLREWRLACPKGTLNLVFPNGAGNVEQHANNLMRGWYPIQVAAGIIGEQGKPRYGFHALRHFCASWLIEQGFSPKRVQVWLGHSSIQMTFDVYGHLFPSLEDDHAKLAIGELAVLSGRP